MNKHHQEILAQINSLRPKKADPRHGWVKKYLGTTKTYYGLGMKNITSLVKEFYQQNKGLSDKEIADLLSSLFAGQSFEEIAIGASLLGRFQSFREEMSLKLLDQWLNNVEGWAEADSICQSNFHASEVISRWPEWEKLLTKLVGDKNVHKRRASLVLLTKSMRQSDDVRLSRLAFSHVGKLEHEKDILITKAVSWALRSMVKHHPAEVRVYLEGHESTLPRIAYRETKKKLETGRKNG